MPMFGIPSEGSGFREYEKCGSDELSEYSASEKAAAWLKKVTKPRVSTSAPAGLGTYCPPSFVSSFWRPVSYSVQSIPSFLRKMLLTSATVASTLASVLNGYFLHTGDICAQRAFPLPFNS